MEVKQHDYVTSSQSDEGLHYLNTSKMFNSVVPLFITHQLCVIMFRVNDRGEIRRGG